MTSNHNSLSHVGNKITSRVETVQMNLCFLNGIRLHDSLLLNKSLWELSNWNRLKSLTLVARDDLGCDPTILGHTGLQAILWARQLGLPPQAATEVTMYYEVLHFLKQFALSKPHLERKIIMNLGIPMFDENGKPARTIEGSKDPNQLLSEVGKAFGGRLIVDGELCYEDGTMVQEMFANYGKLPSTRNSKFYYKKDLLVWRLAALLRTHPTESEADDEADFFYVLSHVDAFATDAVRILVETYHGPEEHCTSKCETLAARTDLWHAIRVRDISRFLSLLPV